jgi:poly-gamma-glutamate capsule biosynthesis protein CapA/YwtB (metallophosphatase superfamily)
MHEDFYNGSTLPPINNKKGFFMMKRFLRFLIPPLVFASVFPPGAALAAESRLVIAGQLMLNHNLALFDNPQFRNEPTIRAIKTELDKVFALIRKNDAVILELESSLALEQGQANATESGRDRKSDFFHEISRASVINLFQNQLRLNGSQLMVAAANNHVSDNGVAGISAMLGLFNDLQIPLAGIGLSAEASAPRYLLPGRDGAAAQKFALVAFATDKVKFEATKERTGVNTLSVISADKKILKADDEQRIIGSIESAHKTRAAVVAYHHNHHWTQPKVNEPGGVEQWRIDFARHCIERGADIYFAHGEPRLQGIEIYRGKPIFYGLGNFAFQTRKVNFYQSEVWESVIAELEFSTAPLPDLLAQNRIKSIKLIPVILNENGVEPVFFETRGLPALAQGETARNILRRLQSLSNPYGTRIDIVEVEQDTIFGRIAMSQ